MLHITEPRITYAVRRCHDLLVKAIVPSARRHLPPQPRMAVIPSDYLGVSIIGNGTYERREIAFLEHLFAAKGLGTTTCLDIGGNIGNHSVALSDSFAEIVAFEPNPPMASLFRTNLLLSGTRNVRLHEVGLGRTDEDLRFSLLEAGNDGSGSFASGRGDILLPVRHGDGFIARHEPDLASGARRIGFVKCDVEGFEDNVFAGLRQTLSRHRPIVAFESNQKPAGEKAWAELKAAGYDTLGCLRETGDRHGRLFQEVSRIVRGYSCWLETVNEVPESRCNLIASVGPVV